MHVRIAALAGLIAASTCATGSGLGSSPGSGLGSSPDSGPGPDPAVGGEAVDVARPVDTTRARLERLAVYDDDFARAELYTWTTIEQLRRVRDTRQLLVADAATGGRASPFNGALQQLAGEHGRAGAIASLLLERPELSRRRYAWPSPFATVMGLGPRRYGDSLIRIELDPRAWIGRFDPQASEPLSFVDMQGAAVGLDAVVAAPERIAALFHVRGPPLDPLAYREYVVCNEAMIAAWSIATPEIQARVEADIALLDALRSDSLAHLPREAALESAAPDWHTASRVPTELALWHASLAFDNPRYQPVARYLEQIAATLRGYEHDGGPPLIVRPSQARTP